MHCVVRLELQRDMQVGGANEGGSPPLRRGGECIVECSFLISNSFFSYKLRRKHEERIPWGSQEIFIQNVELKMD